MSKPLNYFVSQAQRQTEKEIDALGRPACEHCSYKPYHYLPLTEEREAVQVFIDREIRRK